ncbi:MAG TPA: 2-dehydropantoate 2-reductase [Iamia sp.]|nr:2-dehydropantoate 2-reductase [Iamia sp.]
MPRYVVVGAGAIGGTIGGRLAQAGHDVVLVARGAHLAALQDTGLDLRTPMGAAVVSVPAVGSVAEVGWRHGDVALLAVKGQHTEGLLDELEAVAPPDLPIVCAQNGVANEPRALRRFAHVHGMCVMLPAVHLDPGVVAAFGEPVSGILHLGRFPSGADAIDEELAEALSGAGFVSAPRADVMRVKHRKLLMNLANAAVAVAGREARHSDVVVRAVAEGEAALAAAGIDVASAEEDRALRAEGFTVGTVEGVERGLGSTFQSLQRGSGSVEVDTLNGEIVLLGRLHDVPTPVNEALRRLGHRAARERWPAGRMSVADLEAAVLPT